MKSIFYVFGFVTIILLSRWLPHLSNFSILGALAIWSSVLLSSQILAAVSVLGGVFLSDLVLGTGYPGQEWVYLGFFALVGIGVIFKPQKSILKTGLGAFTGSIIFYLISNWGVWSQAGLYSQDFKGLIECYLMGLPFLKTSLLSDLAFSVGFFALYQVYYKLFTKPARIYK